MKIFKNTIIKGYDGKSIPLQELKDGKTEIIGATSLHIFYAILNLSPIQTQNDSIQGMRMALALDKVKDKGGNIELEDGIHDWLKPLAEKLTPQLFRVNGNIVYQYVCEGFEKQKQPKVQVENVS